LSFWGQMTFFVLILSWEARFSWTMVHQVGLQPFQGDFGCVLGGQATNPLSVWGQKNLFCVNFGQVWHLPPQHPGIDLKLSSKGKPGTCALLEILPSPVDFFRRAKLLGLLDKFCILPTYFYKYWWFVIRWKQR
jgi:hypothetical protein